MMQSEVQFLLSRRSDASEVAFLDAMKSEVAHMALAAELASLVPADALSGLPHVAESGSGNPAPAGAILTVRGETECLMDAISAIGKRLGNVVDLTASSIVGAQRYSILPGVAPIRLFFGLRRLERLSRAEFQDYWLNIHADYGRRLIPPHTYHQIHVDAALTGRSAHLTGVPASPLDGIVEVHYPDIDVLIAQLMRPEVVSEALADERNFIDHSRSAFHVYQTL